MKKDRKKASKYWTKKRDRKERVSKNWYKGGHKSLKIEDEKNNT